MKNFGTPELLAAVHRPDWLRDAVSIGVIDSTLRRRHGLHGRAGFAVDQPALAPPRLVRGRHRGRLPHRAARRRAAGHRAGAGRRHRRRLGGPARLRGAQQATAGPGGRRRHGAGRRAPARGSARAGVDARSSTPYFARCRRRPALFIKVLGRDERSADLMFRVYRFLRLKDVGDRGPFSSLQRMVEHEALVALYANDMGVLTPRLVVTTNVGRRRLPARLRADGRRLAGPRARRGHHRRRPARHLARASR